MATTAVIAARPNILIAISDDQSWLHTRATGDRTVRTPAFDQVAANGVLFTHAFTSAPSCTPSRAALLTGQHHWRLGAGANLHSTLDAEFAVYPDLLEQVGYRVGFTGKGWGPGKFTTGGRTRNPAGDEYNKIRIPTAALPTTGLSSIDYAANFDAFLDAQEEGDPFCFWFGGREPHRVYEMDAWQRTDLDPDSVQVPGFMPDHPAVRGDMLDYFQEIEWFDQHLARMLELLAERGELDNTIVIVTSDNGMPFPRAKTSLYDSGVRVPFAMQWPEQVVGGRRVDALVHFTDVAPTLLEAAGVKIPEAVTGRSLLPLLQADESAAVEWPRHVVFGRERHTHYANDGRAFSSRAIRTQQFLLIRNDTPDLWPNGAPPHFTDMDRGSAKFLYLLRPEHPSVKPYAEAATQKRPTVELYDSVRDPSQLKNLANDPLYLTVKRELLAQLQDELVRLGDPRALGQSVTWDRDPYYGGSYQDWIDTQADRLRAYEAVHAADLP